ncbi:hypothetical protein CVM73_25440 [Bradyrhizobium forestalis]|uniref:Uncharacterized protein n=1 Tax=Bradyrhizobium forestalis TaxID=1419263 RepID=A0A2M8R3W8_9BRAD|nr:hypothetical protein CVM73_25440 [Bradyrhizobium forestalis]
MMHKIRSVFIFLCLAALAIDQPRPARAADGPITYFSDEVPLELPKSKLLSSTDQIIVAKVRVLDRPAYLLRPDQSGRPSGEKLLREPWSAWLRVLDVIRGKRPERERLDVSFGGADDLLRSYARAPTTPRQLAQEYFVAMYEDAFGFHLIGLPISTEKYREWQQEITRFEWERQKSLSK